MSFGEYSFLPWLRRGIANQLETPAVTASRASVDVTVRVRSDAGTLDVPPRPVLLVGPGDLVGINPDMVLRTEPRPGIANFEPNYLAYIDFYDEDFAWRYTPARPDAALHRLAPWLTLLVLKEDEFKPLKRRPLPAIELTPAAVLTTIVPPDTELWAWAHVHLNATLPKGANPNLDTIGTLLRQNPDVGYCRLMSPRRLSPNTSYHAFVVPTFEVGRLAGLGVTPPDTTPGLKIAWASGSTFPVYFDWRFSTGAAGDFEDLVTALKPRDIDAGVGIRSMDVQQPGFHLPPTTGQPDDLVGLEGVLLSPATVHVPVAPGCSLPGGLAAEVNRPDDEQKAGVADGDVPLVSVPLYGRWHAFVERVAPFPEHLNWINELNTDPRFRAVAGMGTKVIQKNQESYMQLAWNQIGDVLSLNRKIAFLQVSVKASDALFARQLAPMVTERALAIAAPVMAKVMGSPITVDALVERSRLPRAALSGAMRKQLRPRGQLARRTFGTPGAIDPIAGAIAGLNSGVLTAAPPRPVPQGTTYEGSLAAVVPSVPAWLRWLAKHRWLALILLVVLLLALFVVLPLAAALAIAVVAGIGAAAALPRLAAIERTLETVADFAPAALTPATIAALPPNDAFVLPALVANDAAPVPGPPLPAPSGGPDSVQGAAFRLAALEFSARLSDRALPRPMPAPLALPAIRDTLLRALKPAPAFMARHDGLLQVGTKALSKYAATYHDAPKSGGTATEPADPRIVPVMAYPDIKLPMYRPLKDLQKDNFVPNLHLIPPDTISLMVTNPPVIESYMVGLNHEFARELLWREYPTDQRPSTFRQFWEPSCYGTESLSDKDRAEKVRDIRRIHEWPLESTLGTHKNQQAGDDRPRVVLIIRGELLKRYPHTIVYAQKARWGDAPDHLNHLSLYDETGAKADPDLKDENFAFPIFRAQVEPDIYFVGFDLLVEDVRGDPSIEETAESKARVDPKKLGWFFVLQEVVGEPRFGLDEHKVSVAADAQQIKWDNLSWENLGTAVPLIRLTPLATEPPGKPNFATWGSHAADLAHILYQKPVLVGVHARRMLANIILPT